MKRNTLEEHIGEKHTGTHCSREAAQKKSFSENRLWSLDLAALTDPFGERTLNVERRTTSWIGWVGLTLLNIEENEKKTKSSWTGIDVVDLSKL